MARKMLTTTEAGERLAISAEAVKHLCGKGLVPGAVRRPKPGAIHAPWLVPESWVNAERKRRETAVRTVGHPYALAQKSAVPARKPRKKPISDATGHLGNGTPAADNTSDIVTNPAADTTSAG
jgi:hypothetical protein